MNRLHITHCKTDDEKLNLLKKAHLNLPVLDTDYMPEELCEKRRELEALMLKYIWQWSNEAMK